MEAQEAFRLRRETFGQPCIHTTLVREYDEGKDVGAWACTACGSEFAKWDAWEVIRKYQEQHTSNVVTP